MDYSEIVILVIEIIGTVAFASSGAMLAIKKHMDLFGVCVLGVLTAVGGGMTRDVILGNIPVALIKPVYVVASVVTAVVVFIAYYMKKDLLQGPRHAVYDRILLAMDSLGLGIFTAVGVNVGISAGYLDNTFLLAFLGTLTGVGGGLIRDVVAGVPPYIFVKHIYACASVVGAVCCVWVYRSLGQIPALVISSALVVLIRSLAAHYRWNLPRIRME